CPGWTLCPGLCRPIPDWPSPTIHRWSCCRCRVWRSGSGPEAAPGAVWRPSSAGCAARCWRHWRSVWRCLVHSLEPFANPGALRYSKAGNPLPERSTRMSSDNTDHATRVAAFRDKILAKLTYWVGKDPEHAFSHDWFEAVALATRDHLVDHWMESTRRIYENGEKRVYYLSLEFLIGRLLLDTLSNLGLLEIAREALADLDVDLEQVRQLEPDAALGNGGLGRPAACFMESMATIGLAAHGYGIRYEHGLFRQAIVDGWQQEQA